MSAPNGSILNWIFYLIIIVVFLVILFWVLDRFLIMDGGILLYANYVTNTFCNEIVETPNEVICKLV